MKNRTQVVSRALGLLVVGAVAFSLVLEKSTPPAQQPSVHEPARAQILGIPDLFHEEKRRAAHEELPPQF